MLVDKTLQIFSIFNVVLILSTKWIDEEWRKRSNLLSQRNLDLWV